MSKKLTMIVGGSGAGKTYRLYENLLEKAEQYKKEQFFLIVPEQYTLQAQREIVARSSCHGTMNIDIVSFMRLSYRIFEELGIGQNTVLEDLGKSMLLRRVLGELDGSLHLYNHMMDKSGFLDQIKSVLSEFYQYEVAPEQLLEKLKDCPGQVLLQYKLEDLHRIYLAFEQAMQGQYQVTEQLLSYLAEVVEQSKLLAGAHFFFDGFTGFTPIQYHVIAKLMQAGAECCFTITIDQRTLRKRNCSIYNMYYMSYATYDKLLNCYAKVKEGEEPEIVSLFEEPVWRLKNRGELAHLQQHLFQYPVCAYEGDAKHVHLREMANSRQEAAYVAGQIRQLVRSGRYRYRDIAVVSADEEAYAPYLQEVFAQHNISCFFDHNTQVRNHPYVEALRAALAIVCNGYMGYSYDRMMRYLHTGITGIAEEEIEAFDNYLIATNTRGFHAYKNGFTKLPRSMWKKYYKGKPEQMQQKREQYLEQMNTIRAEIMAAMLPLYQVLQKKSTIRQRAEAIYQYLYDCRYEEKLKQEEEQLQNAQQYEQAKQYGQIFASMLTLLDQLVDILGEETDISNEELAAILDAGLEQMAVGTVPSTMDQVVIGDFTRTRLSGIKVLFVLGMNDGLVPKNVSSPNVLTDEERVTLTALGAELAPDYQQAAYREQFYFYLLVTKPEEELYLSYPRMNGSGEAMRPSVFLEKIEKLLPRLSKEVVEQENYLDTRETVTAWLTEQIKRYEQGEIFSPIQQERFMGMLHLAQEQETYQEILRRILGAMQFQNQETNIGKQLAAALYGQNLLFSVTRLEQFAGCAYAHFLKYVMQLLEREEYAFASVDFGTVLHRVMELFGRKMKHHETWTYETITQEQIAELTEECVIQALQMDGYDFSQETARVQYTQHTILRIAKRTMQVLCRHIKLGSFRPEAFELTFGRGKELRAWACQIAQNVTLLLNGTIDRLDIKKEIKEGQEKNYLRVLDYKTGNKKFDITLAYYGLQVQLLTYMLVALDAGQSGELERTVEGDFSALSQEEEKQAYVPGAMLYYHVQDPVMDAEKSMYHLQKQWLQQDITQENYEEQCRKLWEDVKKQAASQFRMDGLINDAEPVLEAMEHPQNPSSYTFETAAIAYNKDGTLKKGSKCQNEKDIQNVLAYTRNKIRQLGEQVYEGQTQMNPYEYKGMRACSYCPYQGVCHFDERNGNEYRILSQKEIADFSDTDKEGEDTV